MSIEAIWFVKEIQEHTDKKSKPYLTVIYDGEDGKEYRKTILSYRDEDKAAQERLKDGEGLAYHVELDKIKGQWQIMDIYPMKDKIQAAEAKTKTTASVVKSTAQEKPENKNKSFALAYAKDVVVASITPGTDIKMNHFKTIVKGATLFDKWLNGELTLSDKDLATMLDQFNRATTKEE